MIKVKTGSYNTGRDSGPEMDKDTKVGGTTNTLLPEATKNSQADEKPHVECKNDAGVQLKNTTSRVCCQEYGVSVITWILVALSVSFCLASVVIAVAIVSQGNNSEGILKQDRSVPQRQIMGLNSKFTPASAHKQLLPPRQSELYIKEPFFSCELSQLFSATFNKDFNDPLTEHVRGIRVLDTALEINYTGLYYMYMSVHMGPRFGKPAQSFGDQTWFQYVFRASADSPADTGVLLQTSHTPRSIVVNGQETAIAGGTFYLKKGDLITVCMSDPDVIEYKKESTNLGLFMLKSGSSQET